MYTRHVFILLVGLLAFSGCTNLGPRTVPRDRFDYNAAILDSWKQQTLLNIVRIRYADMPLFVEVASVVSGYTLEGSVSVAGTFASDSAVQGDLFELGTEGKDTIQQQLSDPHSSPSYSFPHAIRLAGGLDSPDYGGFGKRPSQPCDGRSQSAVR